MIGKEIGSGGYAQVFCARQRDPTAEPAEVAVKKIKKNEKFTQREFDVEVSALKRVQHPFIIKFFQAHNTEGYFYIIMEYAKGQEMFELVVGKHFFNLATES